MSALPSILLAQSRTALIRCTDWLGFLEFFKMLDGCQKLLLLWVYIASALAAEGQNRVQASSSPISICITQLALNLAEFGFQRSHRLINEEIYPDRGIA